MARPEPWPEPYLNYQYLRRAWETTGRKWLTTYSGVNWSDAGQKWELDPQWPPKATDVAQHAYTLEHAARAAVNMGYVCHDLPLLNELAEFYRAYSDRFTTLGAMRAMKAPSVDTSHLDGWGDDATRTLIWVLNQGERSQVLECSLCNSQFFHPVARLIRIITLLPESERTPGMEGFVSFYAPLVTREHLLRLLYGKNQLVDSYWKKIATSPVLPAGLYSGAFTDRELWLIATAAEILGANATDPRQVALTPDERLRLQEAVRWGVSVLEKRRTLYPDTKNFEGIPVGSVSYFNGDFNDLPEYAYSGYNGETFPTERDKKIHPGTSWDISHSYRIPVFLMSLYENREATGVDFPSIRDIELVTNQLMYRVFQGDFDRPLFNNFLDGSNGWFRVGYHGSKFGYPPAQYCGGASALPCLMTPGALMGWGLLSFANPDLMRLEHSLLTLAWKADPAAKAFKNRYYQYLGDYAFRDAKGQTQFPVLLLWILAGVPEKLQGCGSR